MEQEEWVKHLIERFGAEDAWKFAKDLFRCPCTALDKHCYTCTFKILGNGLHGFGCVEAIQWNGLRTIDILTIKAKIRRGDY
jgi:hypothetical protein